MLGIASERRLPSPARWALRHEGRRPGRPRWTLRLRLTLLYGGLFLTAGAVLLAITYELVAHSVTVDPGNLLSVKGLVAGGPKIVGTQIQGHTIHFSAQPPGPSQTKPSAGVVRSVGRQSPSGGQSGQVRGLPSGGQAAQVRELPSGGQAAQVRGLPSGGQAAQVRQFTSKVQSATNAAITRQRQAQLDALLTRSGVALGIMAFVSIGLGWLMAGRALRPLRTMSARARGMSERNLHERLALDGPNDELKELGDTFDGLLGRLETAFDSQRRFVANASHELRTPITLQRTLVELALADPHPTVESLQNACARVLRAGEQQERLIDALLTLARSQRGLGERERIDLKDTVGEALKELPLDGIALHSQLEEAVTAGDPALVSRLVANLLDNALHHNEPDGWVNAWTGMRGGRPTLRVVNSGPVVPAERTPELLEPFRRLNGDRVGHARGLGLGLSVVGAIATAHGAMLRTTPRPEGGLDVEVGFPALAAPRS